MSSLVDLTELVPVPAFVLAEKTSGSYPTNQLAYLTLEQLESVATTPLELELVARLQRWHDELSEALDVRDVTDIEKAVDDFKNAEVEKALDEANTEDLKLFFDTVVDDMNWPAAEPHNGTLQKAVKADIQRGQACRELTDYLVENKFITEKGDVYNVIEIGTAVVNQWPQLRN